MEHAPHTKNKRKKQKGLVEPEKELDKLELFFCQLYEFHNPVTAAPAFVPADLPPRYAINFVPAAPVIPVVPSPSTSSASAFAPLSFSASVPAPVSGPAPVADDFSVVSSANFIPASVCYVFILYWYNPIATSYD